MAQIKNGAVQIVSEQGLLDRLKSGKRLTVKMGADPSRPDLHLGHSVVLRKLKLFQELGHRIVFVIGDFTAMIGDPSGRNKTRPPLTLDETRTGGESYFKQVTKILDPGKTEIAYNSEWLEKMNFHDVIGLCSKYTVARILERDDFHNRLSQNLPISMHEMLYPLMQGYDSVALNADIEVGGTDQTFNLLVGRALQNDFGQKPQEVITFPLLPGLDGKDKMSKSLDNYIGIDEPPEIMFEKAMRVPDGLLADYFVLTTDILRSDAENLVRTDIRRAHLRYAFMITEMYHNSYSAQNAKRHYESVASGELPQSMAEYTVTETDLPVTELLCRVGFAASNSEARRNIQGRGVKINGETLTDTTIILKTNTPFVLQFGKNRFVKVKKI
ncbi:MAG: tyrosine--tRNA ligase [Oscillospiraceae bacterium]|jgi:tyrosyl-tRNA synthetase|nr:tyrosine--tRNA ligase [Oscillospiraceae bacterium]